MSTMPALEVSSIPEVYEFSPGSGSSTYVVNVVLRVPAASSAEALQAVVDLIALAEVSA